MNFEGLYQTENFRADSRQISSLIRFDKSYWLFEVHFKEKPIVPGAVLLNIARQLCCKATGKKLQVATLSDAKFKMAVEPPVTDLVEVTITLTPEEEGFRMKASYSLVLPGDDGAQEPVRKPAATLSAILKERASASGISKDICFIVPFYNNPRTVKDVIESVQRADYKVIAVDDGSTDGQSRSQAEAACPLCLISYGKNRGKGYALRQGFQKALEMGFSYGVVFDADGQHTMGGAKAMIDKLLSFAPEQQSRSIIVGSRAKRGADSGGKFANNFSNFWLKVQTGRKIGDTQSGLRLYPLQEVCRMKFLGSRYEFETEILVKGVWRGLQLVEVPVEVIYPEDRVTHFRKGADFTRISLMNTYLTLGALFYGYPRMLINRLSGK